MKVVGLDPGRKTGFAVLELEPPEFGKLIGYGLWQATAGESAREFIPGNARELLVGEVPQLVCIEDQFMGANAYSMGDICKTAGALEFVALEQGCKVVWVAPSSMKSIFGGHGRARKKAIMAAVKFHYAVDVKEDVADAIGLAYVGALKSEQPRKQKPRQAARAAVAAASETVAADNVRIAELAGYIRGMGWNKTDAQGLARRAIHDSADNATMQELVAAALRLAHNPALIRN